MFKNTNSEGVVFVFKNVNNKLKFQGLHIKMQHAIHKYAPGKEFDFFLLHTNTNPLRTD